MKDISKFQQEIIDNTEWLRTIDDDEIACISIEILQGLLENYINPAINIIEDDI